MNNKKSNGVDKHTILPEQSLKDLINYCGSVLNLTSEEIKTKYPAHIQKYFEYMHKDKPQKH